MKFLKRKLNGELDKITPDFKSFEKLTPPCDQEEQTGGNVKVKSRFNPKVLIASACAFIIVLCAIIFPIMFAPRSGVQRGFVTLEINPSVIFVTENGKITRTVSNNSDADLVLSDGFGEGLKGKTAQEGVVAFTDRCAKLGYLNLNEQSAVKVGGSQGGDALSAQSALKEYFKDKGAHIAVAYLNVEGESLTALEERCKGADFYSESELVALDTATLWESYYSIISDFAEDMRQFAGFISEEIYEFINSLLSGSEIPKTPTECMNNIGETLNCLGGIRERFYNDLYSAERDSLTDSAYESFIDEIVRTYGSVEDYYENLKK